MLKGCGSHVQVGFPCTAHSWKYQLGFRSVDQVIRSPQRHRCPGDGPLAESSMSRGGPGLMPCTKSLKTKMYINYMGYCYSAMLDGWSINSKENILVLNTTEFRHKVYVRYTRYIPLIRHLHGLTWTSVATKGKTAKAPISIAFIGLLPDLTPLYSRVLP